MQERERIRGAVLLIGVVSLLLAPAAAFSVCARPIPVSSRHRDVETAGALRARPCVACGATMMYGSKPKVIVPQYVLDRERMEQLTKQPYILWHPLGTEEELIEAGGVDLSMTCHSGGVALRKVYHESDRLLVVLYMKDSCSMCRVLQPLIQKVIDTYEEEHSVHYVKLEVIKHKREADKAKLTSTPVLHFIKNGQLLRELTGLQSKKTMMATIDDALMAKEEDSEASRAPYPQHWERALADATGRDIHFPVTGRIGSLSSRSPRGGASAFEPHRGAPSYEDKNHLTDKDELDKDFIRVLHDKVSPAGALVQDTPKVGKRLVGRLADGEINIKYSSSSTDAFAEFDLSEASIYEKGLT